MADCHKPGTIGKTATNLVTRVTYTMFKTLCVRRSEREQLFAAVVDEMGVASARVSLKRVSVANENVTKKDLLVPCDLCWD